MGDTLELRKTENLTSEEEKRREHNAHTAENYRKMMTMGTAEDTDGYVALDKGYPSLSDYRPVHARREITFEDVLIPDEVRNETRSQNYTTASYTSASPDYANSIYTDSAYREAAFRREKESKTLFVPDAEENELSMPTEATLQYAPAATTAQATATVQQALSYASEETRAYYASLAKKVAIVFGVAFVALMAVIIVNTVILNGMELQIVDFQQALTALQMEVKDLQSQIDSETAWDSVWAFIQANGMIPRS